YLLWYCKDIEKIGVNKLFQARSVSEGTTEDPKKLALWLQLPNGFERTLTTEEKREEVQLPEDAKVFRADKVRDSGVLDHKVFEFEFQGEKLLPGRAFAWRGNPDEMEGLKKSNRLVRTQQTLAFKLFLSDSGGVEITSMWQDTAGKIPDMAYVVQTHEKIISRCILMTTNPGDLVLDPTCGSGTAAYVAEKWGRRWITIDTSRVSIALARQRLLTGKFDYFELKEKDKGVSGGFVNKTVPHITLKNIAQNVALDPIFEKHEPILAEKLKVLNKELKTVTPEIRKKLKQKLLEKERNEGKKSITDADRRRWDLPKDKWEEWEVPFDNDQGWPEPLQDALTGYRKAWRAKMDEVNECIAASAEKEELVDQPEVERGILRVSGPFTVEAVQPPEERLDEPSPIDEPEGDLETFDVQGEPTNA
ncbi:unnamed protein product, partial [marine sediment metagenome]